MARTTTRTPTVAGADSAASADAQLRSARFRAGVSRVGSTAQESAPGAALERAMGTAKAFLIAEAGHQFAASLDLDATLRNIGGLVVSWMADWCMLDVLGPDGRLTRTSVAAANPADAELKEEFLGLSLDLDQPSLLGEALKTRVPVLVQAVSEEHLIERAQGPSHLELLRRMRLRSYIAVPLITSGELVGGMLIGCRSGVLGASEMATAEEVGRLAALAIRNARSYEASREALSARDDRLAMVAHDLRAPLSNAVLAAGLLRLRLREAGIGGLDRLLDLIEGSAEHMASLISDLTDAVGLQSGRLSITPRPLSAPALVQEVMASFAAPAEAAGVRLSCEVSEQCGDVAADRTRILQVFSNLVGNALKFTGRGGSIRVTARPDDDKVHFTVADSGVGISSEALSRIFEPFWRGSERKDGGLGLGLTIAREIVQMHGGRIWVDSHLGRGTEVHFCLDSA